MNWIAAVILLAGVAGADDKVQFSVEEIELGKKNKILVEVAETPEQRSRGLMYRYSLPEDRGMLFVFEKPQVLRFWMKNTYIPLSIGYFDEKFRLVQIQDMEPESLLVKNTRIYVSDNPARYALEVRQGWFQRHNIKTGVLLRRPKKKTSKKAGKKVD